MGNLSETLYIWYKGNKRDLPWRNTHDPYVIWLSEIILQQTRVAQGLPYFNRFLEEFQTINKLAEAPEDLVLRLWQGLGYYSRARNLHATAKYITYELNSVFPKSYAEIKKLKGIGEYTAAAIASFAYNEKVPVLDGNVYRLIARYYGVQADISTPSTRKIFIEILEQEIPDKNADIFNQSMMEFGALTCTFKNPDCENCPLIDNCFAYQNNQIASLPVKSKKIKKRDRYFNYVLIKFNDAYAFEKRSEEDIWKGLYQFPLIESDKFLDLKEVNDSFQGLKVVKSKGFEQNAKHLLSHQTIYSQMISLEVSEKGNYNFFTLEEIKLLPKPQLIENFLNNYFHKNA